MTECMQSKTEKSSTIALSDARAVLVICSALARLGIDEEPTLMEIKHASERGRAAVDMAYAIRVN